MSLIIDQTWVSAWSQDRPSNDELKQLTDWLLSFPQEQQRIAKQWPPFCLVKARGWSEMPYTYSVGFVDTYFLDGQLGIRQCPNSDPIPVDADRLELVGFWKGFGCHLVSTIYQTKQLPLL